MPKGDGMVVQSFWCFNRNLFSSFILFGAFSAFAAGPEDIPNPFRDKAGAGLGGIYTQRTFPMIAGGPTDNLRRLIEAGEKASAVSASDSSPVHPAIREAMTRVKENDTRRGQLTFLASRTHTVAGAAGLEARALLGEASELIKKLDLPTIQDAVKAHYPEGKAPAFKTLADAQAFLESEIQTQVKALQREVQAAASNHGYSPNFPKILINGGKPGFATVAALLESNWRVDSLASETLKHGVRSLDLKFIPIASPTTVSKVFGVIKKGKWIAGATLGMVIMAGTANAASSGSAKDLESSGAVGPAPSVTGATVDDFSPRAESGSATARRGVSN